MGLRDIVHVEISGVCLPVDLVAQRARLRDRWSTPKYSDGWGVEHFEAGPFGQFVDGEFCPFRFESEADASRWVDDVIDGPDKGLPWPKGLGFRQE